MTKEQIMSAVWGLYSDVEPSTVAVHVGWLREKLETDPSLRSLSVRYGERDMCWEIVNRQRQ